MLNKHPVLSLRLAEALLVTAFLAFDIMIFLKPPLWPYTISFSAGLAAVVPLCHTTTVS